MKDNIFDAPKPLFGGGENHQTEEDQPIEDSESFEDIGQSPSNPITATWSNVSYCSTSNRLTATLTFNQNVTGLDQNSIDIRNQANTGSAFGWSGQTFTGSGRSYTVTSTAPYNVNYSVRYRLIANGVIAGSQTGPSSPVDTGLIPINNLATSPPLTVTWSSISFCNTSNELVAHLGFSQDISDITGGDFDILDASDSSLVNGWVIDVNHAQNLTAWTLTISPLRGVNGNFIIRLKRNSITYGTLTGPSTNIDTNHFIVNNETTPVPITRPSISIDSGSFCPTDRRITWYAYINNAVPNQLIRFLNNDVTLYRSVNTGPTIGFDLGVRVERTPSTGSSFRIITNQIPVGYSGNARIQIQRDALGPRTNFGVSSGCTPFDTRTAITERPQVIIGPGNFCPTNRTLTWRVFVINASTAEFNLLNNADVTVNDSLTVTPTLNGTETIGNRGENSLTVNVVVPTGRMGNASITIGANALGTDTNLNSVTSACVNYDTRATPVPLIGAWDYANYCETSNKILASITFNKAITGLNIFTSSNLNGDIQIENERKRSPKDGWTFSFTGATGTGNNASLAANTPLVVEVEPPTNTNENVYLVFNSNAITFDTNVTGPSADIYTEVIPVDNRSTTDAVVPLIATWQYANYCSMSDRVYAAVRFNKAITGLDVRSPSTDIQLANARQTANLTGWSLTFSGHTGSGQTATLAANTNLVIEATPPANTNRDVYLLINANAVTSGTQTGPESITYSETIPVNNIPAQEAETPLIATWSNMVGGPTLSGRLTFGGRDVSGIAASDFEVRTILGRATAVTIVPSATSATAGQSITVMATPNTSYRIDGQLFLRLKQDSLVVGSGTGPDEDIDSDLTPLNTFTVWGDPTGGTTLSATMTFGATLSRIATTDFEVIDETDAVQSDWTIAFNPTGTTSRTNNQTLTVTATPPARTSDIFRIRLKESSFRHGSASSDTVPRVAVITKRARVNNLEAIMIPDPLVGRWVYANWCPTSNKVLAAIQFNKAITGLNVNSPSTDIQIANEQQNANLTGWTLSFSGHTGSGTTAALAANTNLVVEATPPANTERNVYLLFVNNSVTADGETGPDSFIYSETIPVNNRNMEVPIPDWDVPQYIQTGTSANFGLRFVNSTRGTMEVSDLESDDFEVTGGANNARVTIQSLVWEITLSAAVSGLSESNISISGNTVTDSNVVAGSGNTKYEILLGTAVSTLSASSVIISQTAHSGITVTATKILEPYQIIVPIPANEEGTINLILQKNAVISADGVRGPINDSSSGTIGFNTTTAAPTPLIATWQYANYCSTSDRILAAVRFNKAITGLNVGTGTNTDIQIANETKTANLTRWTLSFSGHTGSGTNASLAANTSLVIEATPPDDTDANVYLMVVGDSVTAGTQTGPSGNSYSEVIPVDNTPSDAGKPSIAIDGGSFCPTSRIVTWTAYVTNASSTQLDAFTNADVTVNNTVTVGTTFAPTDAVTRQPAGGSSFQIQTDAIPTGRVGSMSITIQANALGSDTNDAVTSSVLYYDTQAETTPLVGEWQYANYCSTSDRVYAAIRFNRAITGLDVRSPNTDIQVTNEQQTATLTGWTLAFSGHTGSGQTAALAANTNLVITATPPADTNRNVYMAFIASSIMADGSAGPSNNIYSETIPVNNEAPEPEMDQPQPYLEITNLPTTQVTTATVDIDLRALLDGQLQNIDNLRSEDIVVTGPTGNIPITLTAR